MKFLNYSKYGLQRENALAQIKIFEKRLREAEFKLFNFMLIELIEKLLPKINAKYIKSTYCPQLLRVKNFVIDHLLQQRMGINNKYASIDGNYKNIAISVTSVGEDTLFTFDTTEDRNKFLELV